MQVRFMLMLTVVTASAFTACSSGARRTAAAEIGTDNSSGQAERLAVADNDDFVPRDFLCSFTGGPSGDSHDMMDGRRYTPDERARARARIAEQLRQIPGLQYREHNYEWIAIDRQWMTREYVAMNEGRGINLLAELHATRQTDEWILVGAHYDSVATTPGADDNASGVTATIMIARQLAALPTRNVNVLFAFFDQEEEGLIGSHAVARELTPVMNILCAHVIDMIGWDSDDDRVVELAHCGMPVAPNDTMMQLYRRAAEQLNARAGETRVGGVVRRDSCRSDHVYFTEYGIPAVQSCEEFGGDDVTPYYHRSADACDTLDYVFLTAVAELVAEVVTIQVQ